MPIIELFTLLLLFKMCLAGKLTENIFLEKYGTYPVNNDKVLIIFVTLNNNGISSVMASVEMVKCCEQFDLSNYDTDCSHMQLDGSSTRLEGHSTTNCTLLYRNMYPYNRKGICTINIILKTNQDRVSKFQQCVPFDTTIQADGLVFLKESNMTEIMKFRNTKNKLKLCESPDEDPLNLCAPVNCHMKYHGHKSLFDIDKRRCVPIPVCERGSIKNSTYTVYDPFDNSCAPVTVDLDCVSNGTKKIYEADGSKSKKSKYSHQKYHSNLWCDHGKLNETSWSCVCDDKRESRLNWSAPYTSTVPVYMCTVKTCDKYQSKFLSQIRNGNLPDIIWSILSYLAWHFIISLLWIILVRY